ncbi:hypothetical protein BRADI_2g57944v3 [Brachypodium distachyon]|uniref:Uncharacterized protein n=1 Tax=Brachypodium distachyon TaxID=15368 RepID=A0A0Q3GIX8_BRADI|nr:hypothetical protein BRADI_2g57944v3 [Brachypodium distachyon]
MSFLTACGTPACRGEGRRRRRRRPPEVSESSLIPSARSPLRLSRSPDLATWAGATACVAAQRNSGDRPWDSPSSPLSLDLATFDPAAGDQYHSSGPTDGNQQHYNSNPTTTRKNRSNPPRVLLTVVSLCESRFVQSAVALTGG